MWLWIPECFSTCSIMQASNLRAPLCRTSHPRKSVTYKGTTYWNDLPHGVRNSTSRNIFKMRLKGFLVEDYRQWMFVFFFFFFWFRGLFVIDLFPVSTNICKFLLVIFMYWSRFSSITEMYQLKKIIRSIIIHKQCKPWYIQYYIYMWST